MDDGNYITQEVEIKGMTCEGCANSVKTRFEKVKGIHSVEIDLENNKAILGAEFEIPKESLETVLEDTNYEVVDYTVEDTPVEPEA